MAVVRRWMPLQMDMSVENIVVLFIWEWKMEILLMALKRLNRSSGLA